MLVASTLPASRSVQVGDAATFFATVINASGETAADCRIELLSDIPATFSYQRTDPATNATIGEPGTPADIGPNAAQSYLLGLTASAVVDPTDVQFSFLCDNAAPAGIFSGLNTLRFSASVEPGADVIALAATINNDGIVATPPTDALGFFTVASINLGSSATVTVTPRVTGASPDAVWMCESDPVTAACLGNLAQSVTTEIAQNATPTFSVFLGDDQAIALDPAGTRVFLDFEVSGVLKGATSVALKSATDSDWFRSSVSPRVVQSRCVACHVDGGLAQATPLIFTPGPGQETLNLDVLRGYVDSQSDGANRVLAKIQGGIGHGGGRVFAADTPEFGDLSALFELMGYEVQGLSFTPDALFDGVTMTSPEKTLTRAAILFAGRMPTDAEKAATTSDAALRTLIRGYMQGEAFHAFLIEGANDRLLTQKPVWIHDPRSTFIVDFPNLNVSRYLDAEATGDFVPYDRWLEAVQRGFREAPVELVAHVVENDLPYSEILTADYIMANAFAAEAYGASTASWSDVTDANEYHPVRIRNYYAGQEKVVEDLGDAGIRVLDPSSLFVDYPHAGILNTQAFLFRYPSTATNRNRARSRWTYYHFLGLDVEKSASRTTDPEALADTNNPTLNNPNCIVCHEVLDPVAGAYQNYGDQGYYRDADNGADSLAGFYKYPEDGSASPFYVEGDTWYRDMRAPGLGTELAPDPDNSLQWLAAKIVADERFAKATVKFWWPALFGAETLRAPAVATDPTYAADLVAFTAQSREVEGLARLFREGVGGGPALNLKDLLVEMVMSAWFRADAHDITDVDHLATLEPIGAERILTPEQLARKTASVTGFSWRRNRNQYSQSATAALTNEFRLYYGGIDSDGLTDRNYDVTALMAAVARAHAAVSACPVVLKDLYLLPPGDGRLLTGGLDLNLLRQDAEVVEITEGAWEERALYSVSLNLADPDARLVLQMLNPFFDEGLQDDRNVRIDRMVVRDVNGIVLDLEMEDLPVNEGCGNALGFDTGDAYDIYGDCAFPFSLADAAPGPVTVDLTLFAEQVGNENARLGVFLETETVRPDSAASLAVKQQIVRLFDRMFGETLTVDDPEVERVFDLFVATWTDLNARNPGRDVFARTLCEWESDYSYLDGIVDDARIVNEFGDLDWDLDVLDRDFYSRDFSDPNYMAQTWMAVIAHLMMDYRYVYL